MAEPKRHWLGRETLVVDNTAGGVAFAAIPKGAMRADLKLEGNQIRWTPNGDSTNTNPAGVVVTATLNGRVMDVGDSLALEMDTLLSFRAIRTGAGSGTLQVDYWG